MTPLDRLSLALCFALAAVACTRKTEFVPLPQFAQEGGCTDPERPGVFGRRTEPIVVDDPPDDRAELIRLVEAYDRRTLEDDVLSNRCAYERMFYRETSYTPRDYKEGIRDYFHHDRFEDHTEDIILEVEWRGGHATAKYRRWKDGVPAEEFSAR